MIHKIFAVILTVLITVSAFSAYGLVLNDCPDPSCRCCRGAAMAGKMEAGQIDKLLKIQAPKSCCCGEAEGNTCRLTTLTPFDSIGWALSPNRADHAHSTLYLNVSMDDVRLDSQATFHASSNLETAHKVPPAIYLAVMSFLC